MPVTFTHYDRADSFEAGRWSSEMIGEGFHVVCSTAKGGEIDAVRARLRDDMAALANAGIDPRSLSWETDGCFEPVPAEWYQSHGS